MFLNSVEVVLTVFEWVQYTVNLKITEIYF